MFNKKQETAKPQYEKIDTVVGRSTLIEGILKTEEPLRIDGKIQGEVISKADMIIAEKGHIAGNVTCQNLMLAGTVHGNITAAGQLHITASGKLKGDASIHSFIVDEKGVFDGKCHMISAPEEEPLTQPDDDPIGNQDKNNRPSRRNR